MQGQQQGSFAAAPFTPRPEGRGFSGQIWWSTQTLHIGTLQFDNITTISSDDTEKSQKKGRDSNCRGLFISC